MSAVTAALYRGVARSGLTQARRRRGKRAVVFCFHNVTGPGTGQAGDRSLHMPAEEFVRLLTWIAAAHAVVPLREIIDRLATGRPLGGTAAITFDDTYQGVIRHAVPALRRAGAPATTFVVPRAAAAPCAFWWDVLAAEGLLGAESRRRALEEYRGDSERVLAAMLRERRAALPADRMPASWAEIRDALGDGIDVGSHSRSHRNLAALSVDELDDELAGSRAELAAQLDRAPDLVSYPYGRCNAGVIQGAARAGYRGGFTMEYGLAGPQSLALALPRVNVPAGIPQEALECWAVGLRWRARR